MEYIFGYSAKLDQYYCQYKDEWNSLIQLNVFCLYEWNVDSVLDTVVIQRKNRPSPGAYLKRIGLEGSILNQKPFSLYQIRNLTWIYS